MEHHDEQLSIYTIGPNGKDEHGQYEPKKWSVGGPDTRVPGRGMFRCAGSRRPAKE